MLRCTLLLHFGERTPCYVVHFVVLRWTRFMLRCSLVCRVQRGSPKVLAHTGTIIDSCWKACKNMLPGSLSSQSPMIMTYVKAWQRRYIHRNANVWHHCKDGPQVEVMEKNHWRCGETRNHPKNVTFFEGVQHAFLNSHCSKTFFPHLPGEGC